MGYLKLQQARVGKGCDCFSFATWAMDLGNLCSRGLMSWVIWRPTSDPYSDLTELQIISINCNEIIPTVAETNLQTNCKQEIFQFLTCSKTEKFKPTFGQRTSTMDNIKTFIIRFCCFCIYSPIFVFFRQCEC